MEYKKNNKFLIITTIILCLLVVLMGSYIIYDNFNDNQNNNKENQNNNISNNSIAKLDNNKDWVYSANYTLSTDKESYTTTSGELVSVKNLIVPYINIDTSEAKSVNTEIYKLYESLIDEYNIISKWENPASTIKAEYNTYINNDILSVIIITTITGTDVPLYKYYTYNFNLINGNLLSYEDVYKINGFNANNIDDKANQAITNYMKKEYSFIPDFDTYNNMSISNYKASINNNKINFFIGENKKLNVIVTLNIPVGREEFDQIITIE